MTVPIIFHIGKEKNMAGNISGVNGNTSVNYNVNNSTKQAEDTSTKAQTAKASEDEYVDINFDNCSLDDVTNIVTILKEELSSLEVQLNNMQHLIESDEIIKEGYEKRLETLQKELQEASSQINSAKTPEEKGRLQTKIFNLRTSINMLNSQISAMDGMIKAHGAMEDVIENNYSNVNTQYNQAVSAQTSKTQAISQPSAQVSAVSTPATQTVQNAQNGGTYTYSGSNEQFVNKFNSSAFNKGVLAGKGAMIASIAEKNGLDPNLLAAIMANETGWGTSNAIRNHNNPGGMMDPATNWSKIKTYSTLEEGINAVASNLKRNYIDQGLTTISTIGAKYCPVGAANDPNGLNSNWVPGVTSVYNDFTGANITSGTKIA